MITLIRVGGYSLRTLTLLMYVPVTYYKNNSVCAWSTNTIKHDGSIFIMNMYASAKLLFNFMRACFAKYGIT